MSLGDIGAFEEWLAREDPPYSLLSVVKGWIERLDSAPWQAPSVPVDFMSVEGVSQVREAVVEGVDILYSEDYATGRTDLLHVGSRARE